MVGLGHLIMTLNKMKEKQKVLSETYMIDEDISASLENKIWDDCTEENCSCYSNFQITLPTNYPSICYIQ